MVFIDKDSTPEIVDRAVEIDNFLRENEALIGGDPAQERVAVLLPGPKDGKSFSRGISMAERAVNIAASLGIPARVCPARNPSCMEKQDILLLPCPGALNQGETALLLSKAFNGASVFITGEVKIPGNGMPRELERAAELRSSFQWGKGFIRFLHIPAEELAHGEARRIYIGIFEECGLEVRNKGIPEGSIFRPWRTSKGWGLYASINVEKPVKAALPNGQAFDFGKGLHLLAGSEGEVAGHLFIPDH